MFPSLPISLALLALGSNVDALRLPMAGRAAPKGTLSRFRRSASLNGAVGVDDSSDITYTVNMTIGGQPRTILIDTGSSDLWTIGQVDNAVDTGLPASISYAKGDANGNIFTADVEFGGYTVTKQAYINVTGGNNPPGDGLIGLGPYTSSVVHATLNSAAGDPVLNRIFAQNTSTSNYMSFTLSRSSDPTNVPGELTVGELITGFENVTSTPKNEVQILPTSETGAQHWSLLVDSINGPDGQPISYNTTVPGSSKAVAVLDSGFSFPQVPREVADAFYGRVQGASWVEDTPAGPAWSIPCGQLLTASFVIGGVTYDVHPLDMSFAFTNTDGSTSCYGAFQPSTITFSDASSQFDMVLGMAFLRNTYTVINFGDYVDATTQETNAPFIQLLSTTDSTTAHSDFVTARLNGQDTTSDSQWTLLPASEGLHSPSQPGNSKITTASVKNAAESTAQKVKKILMIVGIVVGGLVIIGLALCILGCCGICSCLRRSGRSNVGFRGMETRQVYQPLNAPVPQGHEQGYGHHGYIA